MLSEGVVAGAPLLPAHGTPLNATDPREPVRYVSNILKYYIVYRRVAALNVLDGTVLGRCMQRHRHQGIRCVERDAVSG